MESWLERVAAAVQVVVFSGHLRFAKSTQKCVVFQVDGLKPLHRQREVPHLLTTQNLGEKELIFWPLSYFRWRIVWAEALMILTGIVL